MIDADTLVDEHFEKTAGLLDRLFGKDDDPLDNALRQVGKDYNRALKRLVPKILSTISKAAAMHGVDENYLNYVIYRNRQSWPTRGKDSYALEVARELVVDDGKMPRIENIPVNEDHSKVDKAILSVAKWAVTDMAKEALKMLYSAASKHAKPLIRKLKENVTPSEMMRYVVVKFAQKLRQQTAMFENQGRLSTLVNYVLV